MDHHDDGGDARDDIRVHGHDGHVHVHDDSNNIPHPLNIQDRY